MRGLAVVLAFMLVVLLSGSGRATASKAEEYFREGYVASMSREWDEAIDWYTKSIQVDPKNPEVYFQRAITFEMTGHPERAIADYQKTLELKPDYYLAMEYLAKLYERSGHYGKALGLYKRALPLVENRKWRTIVKQWISQAEKSMRAASKKANPRGKSNPKDPLF
ncbi:MAG: tetratricopeptide repeat protein [Deltaproteobacteria bacterium]